MSPVIPEIINSTATASCKVLLDIVHLQNNNRNLTF
jgi:hypothetical protein